MTDTVDPVRDVPVSDRVRTSGERAFWIFLLTEMTGFVYLFVVFLVQRSGHRDDFEHGRALLGSAHGAASTFLLLTASLCVALAVEQVQRVHRRNAQALFALAGTCGIGFMVNKAVEWHGVIAAGGSPESDLFFQMFFMIAGLHLLHVVVAMIVLGFAGRALRRSPSGRPGPRRQVFVANAALYWHMVDLLWVGIFAVVYLAG